MNTTAAQKGSIFTRYSLIIIALIVVAAILLFLAGDFVYSQIRPTTPTISVPTDGTSVGNNPPTFQGEMQLHSAIVIALDGKEVATRSYEGQTLWNYTPEQQLEVGDHTLQITAIGDGGLKSEPSEVITFSVPKRPQITSMYDGEEFNINKPPIFEGEAAPNVEVNIYIDDQFVQSVTSNENGKWKLETLPRLVSGTHSIYVNAVETIGVFDNVSEKFTFTVVTPNFAR